MEKQGLPARRRILSVSVHDCEVQTFRSGGSGGQNQNKRDTGVRIIHHPSGARGESREQRSQLQNKKVAFYRMVTSDKFKLWLRIETGREVVKQQEFDFLVPPEDIKTEIRVDGQWVEPTVPLY
jgi:protein subunit release factor B